MGGIFIKLLKDYFVIDATTGTSTEYLQTICNVISAFLNGKLLDNIGLFNEYDFDSFSDIFCAIRDLHSQDNFILSNRDTNTSEVAKITGRPHTAILNIRFTGDSVGYFQHFVTLCNRKVEQWRGDAELSTDELTQKLKALDSATKPPKEYLSWRMDCEMNGIDRLESDLNRKGIKFGFHQLDFLTGGISASDICVVGARSGVGKTAFCFSSAIKMAKDGLKVLYFSLEMSAHDLRRRHLYSPNGINLSPIGKHPNEKGQLVFDRAELERIDSLHEEQPDSLFVIDDMRYIEDIERYIRSLPKEKLPDIVFFDQLSLLQSRKAHSSIRDTYISICNQIKSLCCEAERQFAAVIAVQLNREAQKSFLPEGTHIAESDYPLQVASQVILLHRFDYKSMQDCYSEVCEIFDKNPEELQQMYDSEQECALLILEKNRYGKKGQVRAIFDGKRTEYIPFT